jgi:MFS transporter, DHA3 family, macrolide efflux protein
MTSHKLFNRNFTLVFAGQCISFTGSALYSVVLVLYLKQMTGSATVIGIVELLAFLPWVLLGPFAGTLVDRSSRKTMIVWCDLLRGLLMLVLFIAGLDHFAGLRVFDVTIAGFHFARFPVAVYAVFFVTVLVGIIDSAFNSTLYSIVPEILAKEKIQKGNSLFQGAGGMLAMAGNALGGIFFTFFGAALAFLINGISYLAAALASLFISAAQEDRPDRPAFSYRSFFRETREGLLFIWANKGLRNQTIIYALSNLLFPTVMLSLPFLVEDVLHLKSTYYGYLLSMLTLSSIAGYFLFGLFKTTEKQNYGVICSIFVVEALLFLFLSFTANVFSIFLLLSLLSLCMAISRLINTSLKQKVIPDNLRGRVFGTLDSINGALVPLSFVLSGIAIDLTRKNIMMLFSIIFGIYALLAIAFIFNRPIRQFYLNSDRPASIDNLQDHR